jgi:hypothetical protein
VIAALRGTFARPVTLGSYRLFRCLRCNARLPRPGNRDSCDVRCTACGETHRASYKGWGEYTLRLRDATPEQVAALLRRLRRAWWMIAPLLLPLALYTLVRALR